MRTKERCRGEKGWEKDEKGQKGGRRGIGKEDRWEGEGSTLRQRVSLSLSKAII